MKRSARDVSGAWAYRVGCRRAGDVGAVISRAAPSATASGRVFIRSSFPLSLGPTVSSDIRAGRMVDSAAGEDGPGGSTCGLPPARISSRWPPDSPKTDHPMIRIAGLTVLAAVTVFASGLDAQTRAASCAPENAGLVLPTGFCATL